MIEFIFEIHYVVYRFFRRKRLHTMILGDEILKNT